jgi:hypothetical protein
MRLFCPSNYIENFDGGFLMKAAVCEKPKATWQVKEKHG